MNPSDIIFQLVVPQGVGDAKRLNVHSGILCKSSKFFQNATKSEWANMQAGPNTVDLPDDPVDTVSDYVKWLYYDKIAMELYLEAGEDAREKRAEEAEKVFVALAKAYVFGEKMIDLKYKNAVLRTIFEAQQKFNWHMGPESVKIVCEGTPPKSPLRRLVAENVAYKAREDSDEGVGWMQFIDAYPREALVDALRIMAKVRKSAYNSAPGVESYLENE